jgi:4-diphosphocytidyl-2-C-methyl-D-erythritol kinase
VTVRSPEADHRSKIDRAVAPAKLTLSLRVTGVRDDGLHLIDAEMVSIDLADELVFAPGTGISIIDEVPGGLGVAGVPEGADNLVARALRAVGRDAAVQIRKRIPVGAGLGGGSTDAAAVLRWAGIRDLGVAARLGADVPFCVEGGHARVTGIGETLESLPFADRRFVVVLPPLSMDTAAVYRAYDDDHLVGAPGTARPADGEAVNDLEASALRVEPELGPWRERLAEMTGCRPQLAGSGAAWFVEATPKVLASLVDPAGAFLSVGSARAPIVSVRTVPIGY